MNYYSHNIGDFAVETKYMTFEQKGLYIDMIDRYLSTGKPLDTHWVATIKRLASEGAVDAVLMLCFEERDGSFYNERCEKIIADYEAMAEKNRRNALKRSKKTTETEANKPLGNNGNGTSLPSGNPLATQSVATNNQKPITNNHREEKVEKEISVSDSEAEKSKRSRKKPVTSCPFSADEVAPEKFLAHAKEKHPNLNAQEEFSKFVNFHLSKGSQFADWLAAFRTWMTNAEKFAANSRFTGQQKRKTTPGFGVQLEQDPCDPSTWDQQAIEEVFRRSEEQLNLANIDDTDVPF